MKSLGPDPVHFSTASRGGNKEELDRKNICPPDVPLTSQPTRSELNMLHHQLGIPIGAFTTSNKVGARNYGRES